MRDGVAVDACCTLHGTLAHLGVRTVGGMALSCTGLICGSDHDDEDDDDGGGGTSFVPMCSLCVPEVESGARRIPVPQLEREAGGA